jgi:hypothetical protein
VGVLTVSPLENAAAYDEITIAGVQLVQADGIVEVTGAARKYSWDAKQAPGSQGSTITYRSWQLAKPKLKFKFWQAAQINGFYQRFVPLLAYDATKTDPRPFQVYHPKLFANDIIYLVTEHLGDLEHEGAQLWTITVETLEYRQAKSVDATSTPESANTAGGADGDDSVTKPSVTRELRRLIEAERVNFNWPGNVPGLSLRRSRE